MCAASSVSPLRWTRPSASAVRTPGHSRAEVATCSRFHAASSDRCSSPRQYRYIEGYPAAAYKRRRRTSAINAICRAVWGPSWAMFSRSSWTSASSDNLRTGTRCMAHSSTGAGGRGPTQALYIAQFRLPWLPARRAKAQSTTTWLASVDSWLVRARSEFTRAIADAVSIASISRSNCGQYKSPSSLWAHRPRRRDARRSERTRATNSAGPRGRGAIMRSVSERALVARHVSLSLALAFLLPALSHAARAPVTRRVLLATERGFMGLFVVSESGNVQRSD